MQYEQLQLIYDHWKRMINVIPFFYLYYQQNKSNDDLVAYWFIYVILFLHDHSCMSLSGQTNKMENKIHGWSSSLIGLFICT